MAVQNYLTLQRLEEFEYLNHLSRDLARFPAAAASNRVLAKKTGIHQTAQCFYKEIWTFYILTSRGGTEENDL